MSETEWNEFVCPRCKVSLSRGDLSRIDSQVRRVRPGDVAFTENWWKLKCGHSVESIIDLTKGFEHVHFKLKDRTPAATKT